MFWKWDLNRNKSIYVLNHFVGLIKEKHKTVKEPYLDDNLRTNHKFTLW